MNKTNTNRGFTLIELLVVISLIGTLSTIVLAALGGTREKANDAKKAAEVRSVGTALKIFSMNNNGTAPGNYLSSAGTFSSTNLDPASAMPAKEGYSTASTQAYNKSMDELVDAGILSTRPKSSDNSYSYFDYGGPDGQGAAFFVSQNGICGFSFTGSDGVTYGTVTGADGKCWLDRNLGATQVAVSSTDTASYGWSYQWGRPRDGHQIPTSGTIATKSTGDVPGHANFITSSASPFDWRDPQNHVLWQGANGVNNPCPSGFRLPTQTEWLALISAANITNSSTAFSSTLKIPLAGYRTQSGTVAYRGTQGRYWSSSQLDTGSYYVDIRSTGVWPDGGTSHAVGLSVRCIKN
ncbi:MAG: FISUMP domain-containing protein [Candidatus Paceibacterota bacterium]|jgi:uncharacterized protein (TIGR02145 family)/prepilin-type N-terminal cleavage/methylation domain-containing protein